MDTKLQLTAEARKIVLTQNELEIDETDIKGEKSVDHWSNET